MQKRKSHKKTQIKVTVLAMYLIDTRTVGKKIIHINLKKIIEDMDLIKNKYINLII